MSEKGTYRIMVGDPTTRDVQVGTINKRRDKVMETVSNMSIPSPAVIISNYVLAWGKRVNPAKPDKIIQDVSDADYFGEVVPMKWGEDGGQPIALRCLKGTKSLDVEFQNNRLKIAKQIIDNEAMLVLESGENVFHESTDKPMIEMLKVHYKNKHSKSKDPQFRTFSYYEVDNSTEKPKAIRRQEQSIEAGSIVRGLDTDMKSLRNLCAIMGGANAVGNIDDEKKDYDIYKGMLGYATEYGDIFIAKLDAFKKEVSDLFTKADTYGILDTTKDGVIILTDAKGKKTTLIDGIDAKAKNTVAWVVSNCFNNKAYEAINALKNHLSTNAK